jgi:hypothetical protein
VSGKDDHADEEEGNRSPARPQESVKCKVAENLLIHNQDTAVNQAWINAGEAREDAPDDQYTIDIRTGRVPGICRLWRSFAGCGDKAGKAPDQKANVASTTDPTREPVAETPGGSAASTGNRTNGAQAATAQKCMATFHGLIHQKAGYENT